VVLLAGALLAPALGTPACGAAPAATPPPVGRSAAVPVDPPCPIAVAPPLPGAKPTPVPTLPPPPPRAPDAPVAGGERMASTGLVLPDRVPALPSLTARGWVVADLDSGAVLGACAPHERYAPASVQKLLTALTVLPKLDAKRVVAVSQADLAFEPGSSAVGLVKGGRYTVSTLLLGLLMVSGNDAANVLARVAGGPRGVAGTMAAMNAEAARLGARDTHAVTPSGLDAPGQWTSAYDLALIARAAFDRPDFRWYAAVRRAPVPAQPPTHRGFQIQNQNRLLATYPGTLGGKTGFTDLARHTFVGVAQRGGRRLVVTLLHGEHRPTRLWQQAAGLLDWGFAVPAGTAPVGLLVAPGERIGSSPSSAPPARRGDAPAARAAPPAESGRPPLLEVAAVAGGAAAIGLLGAAAVGLSLSRRRRARDRAPGAPPGAGVR
jgi:D-alanyl-D-alanine carboxypeptidase (penicillin-binding protein 5/6)